MSAGLMLSDYRRGHVEPKCDECLEPLIGTASYGPVNGVMTLLDYKLHCTNRGCSMFEQELSKKTEEFLMAYINGVA